MQESLSPLIAKHLRTLEKDPRSRVFAQLAENYRKLRFYDKALNTLKKGIRLHPDYVPGYLELGRVYFEMEQFQLAYSTLRPLASQNRDNLKFQQLFATTCEEMGLVEEALETYKLLLYVNPKDKQSAERVSALEEQLNTVVFDSEEHNEFSVELLDPDIKEEEERLKDWVQVDLNQAGVTSYTQLATDKVETEPESDWSSPHHRELPSTPEPVDHEKEVSPVITHTLVDLYLQQGYQDKALEVLNKILELHPNDQKTLDKISEIQSSSKLSESPEEEGQDKLTSLLDETLGDEAPEERVLAHHNPSDYLKKFGEMLKERSEDALQDS